MALQDKKAVRDAMQNRPSAPSLLATRPKKEMTPKKKLKDKNTETGDVELAEEPQDFVSSALRKKLTETSRFGREHGGQKSI